MIQIRITRITKSSKSSKKTFSLSWTDEQTIFFHETDDGQFFEIINAIGEIGKKFTPTLEQYSKMITDEDYNKTEKYHLDRIDAQRDKLDSLLTDPDKSEPPSPMPQE